MKSGDRGLYEFATIDVMLIRYRIDEIIKGYKRKGE